jgi:hypothetical protein
MIPMLVYFGVLSSGTAAETPETAKEQAWIFKNNA